MIQKRSREELESAAEKAAILAEALPWINKMSGKTFVVKYGGAAMEDRALCNEVVKDLVLMHRVGVRLVLVHGGGKAINSLMKRLDAPVQFKNGLRVTDDVTMEIVKMALVGDVNQMLVSQINAYGEYGVSITGADGRTLEAVPLSKDLGRVGAVSHVNTKLIETVLDEGYIPVIAGVGWAPSGAYNINADLAASEIAIALKADKLIYLSDVDGLYRDFSDKDSLFSTLTLGDAQELINSGELEGGMIPKVKTSVAALEAGVERVHFLNGTYPHSILLEVFTDSGVGTMFKQND